MRHCIKICLATALSFTLLAAPTASADVSSPEPGGREVAGQGPSATAGLANGYAPYRTTTYTWVGVWQPAGRTTYQFDAQNRGIASLTEVWNQGLLEWLPASRSDIAWSTHSGPDQITSYIWNGAWDQNFRTTQSYNAQDLVEETTTQSWVAGAWMNLSRNTATYDGSGNEIEAIGQSWSGTMWDNQSRTTSTYTAGKLTEAVDWFWAPGWQQSERITSSYVGDLVDQDLIDTWTGADWELVERNTYTYAGGLAETITTELWTGLDWIGLTRSNFVSYDAQDRLTEEITETWGFFAGAQGAAPQAWENSSRYVIQYDAATAVSEAGGVTRPESFQLLGNYPNPFNPATTISFALSEPTFVSIDVFNTLGQRVARLGDRVYDAGRHEIQWNGRDARGAAVGSGAYFYRLRAGDQVETRKMTLMR